MLSVLRALRKNALDLVFPIRCISCGEEGTYLCPPCSRKLKRCEFQICPTCGKLSPFGRTHPECRTEFSLDGLLSTTPYKELLSRKLVELMKYHFISDIAEVLGKLVTEEIQNQEMQGYFNEFILVPLPLHKTREKWRGYNQANLIAQEVSRLTKMRIENHILFRIKKTKVQAELKDEERPKNVQGAFATLGTTSGKYIVVDDVSTTRSTLAQACLALKKSGAQEVWGLVFAQG
jgi:ComF family protein